MLVPKTNYHPQMLSFEHQQKIQMKETSLSLQYNRARQGSITQELTESGNYHLWLQDPAGNSTDYQFKIQIYLNINAIVFVVLILVLIALLVFYLIYSRRKLRVR